MIKLDMFICQSPLRPSVVKVEQFQFQKMKQVPVNKNPSSITIKSQNNNNYNTFQMETKPSLWTIIQSFSLFNIRYLILMTIMLFLYMSVIELILLGNIRFSMITMWARFLDMLFKTDYMKDLDKKVDKFNDDILKKIWNTFDEDNKNPLIKYKELRSFILFKFIYILLSIIAVVLIDQFILTPLMYNVMKSHYDNYMLNIMNSVFLSAEVELDKLYVIMVNLSKNATDMGDLLFHRVFFIGLLILGNYSINYDYYTKHSNAVEFSFIGIVIKLFKMLLKYISDFGMAAMQDSELDPLVIEMTDIFLDSKDSTGGNKGTAKENVNDLFLHKFKNILNEYNVIDFTKIKDTYVAINKFILAVFSLYVMLFLYVKYISIYYIGYNKINDNKYKYYDIAIKSYDTFNSCNIVNTIIKDIERQKNDTSTWKFINMTNLGRDILVLTFMTTLMMYFVILPFGNKFSEILTLSFNNFGFLLGIMLFMKYIAMAYGVFTNVNDILPMFYSLKFYKSKQSQYITEFNPQSIVIDQAAIGYDTPLMILADTVEFEKGAIYRLNGPSGGGKTTFINTILNAIPRLGGKVFIKSNNRMIPIDQISKISLYKQLAYCPQFFSVTNVTLRDLILTNAGIDEEQGNWIINFVCMDKWFKSLPDKWNTFLVDLNSLSGGQRNLLKLAIELAKLIRVPKPLTPKEQQQRLLIADQLEKCNRNDMMDEAMRKKYVLEGILFTDETFDNIGYQIRRIIIWRLFRYVLMNKMFVAMITHMDNTIQGFPTYNMFIGNGKCFMQSYIYGEI